MAVPVGVSIHRDGTSPMHVEISTSCRSSCWPPALHFQTTGDRSALAVADDTAYLDADYARHVVAASLKEACSQRHGGKILICISSKGC
jgi:hypothetical protein